MLVEEMSSEELEELLMNGGGGISLELLAEELLLVLDEDVFNDELALDELLP